MMFFCGLEHNVFFSLSLSYLACEGPYLFGRLSKMSHLVLSLVFADYIYIWFTMHMIFCGLWNCLFFIRGVKDHINLSGFVT